MPRYDVFLSHASADKPAVEQLARKLREKGLKPFLDKWHLIPGEPWQEGMEKALRESRTCAVFLGKALGPWQNEEMRAALARRVKNRSYRVIPVLLPGGSESGLDDLSEFLGRLTWVDFRTSLDDEDAFRRLLAGLRGEAPGPGGGGEPHSFLDRYRCMAPAREPFIQRSEYAKVRDALLADREGRATTVGITTAIHGAGGFGKTALAIELCYDERVRAQYPDGILWTTMGEEIDAAGRLARVRDLIRWWTEEDPPAFETVSGASAHLRQELDGKRVLLVVDDVWRPEDVTPLRGLDPRAALLITTRDSRTLPADSVPVHVDSMEIPEAVQLLGAGMPGGAEAELRTLAARLGEWPLLLKLVNRQLASWISKGLNVSETIRRAENTLKAKGLTYFDLRDAKERSQASTLTLEASLEQLSKEDQERFAKLAIFPEDANVPLAVLEKLWQLDSIEVEELASRFFDLSLLRDLDLRSRTSRLHDMVHAYLLKKGECHLVDWHQRLLNVSIPASRRWADLPYSESYLWNQLTHHLIGAGMSGTCRELLLDFNYLRFKLEATDVNALLADYSLLAEKDEELRLVRDSLLLSAHALARVPAELPGQLLGRLLDRKELGIQILLQRSKESGVAWLRPLKSSLNRPGGALIRTIKHPGVPSALAVLPYGQVISGSDDGTIRVWDVERGQALHVLTGHSNKVNAVAVLDGQRVISASDDGTLRVWDVERGQILHVLEGHFSRVNAVAVLDSFRVVSGSDDTTLQVWNVVTGESLQILEGHSDEVKAVVVMRDGRVVSGSSDQTLRVWDSENGKAMFILSGHYAGIEDVEIVNCSWVITRSSVGTLRIWDVDNGKSISSFQGHHWATSMVVLDSRYVIYGSRNRTLCVCDLESNFSVHYLEEKHSAEVGLLATLSSRYLVSGDLDGALSIWDVEGRYRPCRLEERHSAQVRAMAVLPNGHVVSGSWDGTLRVWDVTQGEALSTLGESSNRVHAVAVLDGRRIISGSDDQKLRVWDVETGRILRIFERHPGKIAALAALDSCRVISLSNHGALRMWDLRDGENIENLGGYFSVQNIPVLEDDQKALWFSDLTLRVWEDLETGRSLQVLREHFAVSSAVAVLDHCRVVFGSNDWILRIWDVENGEVIQFLEGHSGVVNTIAVLDCRRVVSGSADRTLRVWDMESGRALQCLEGHSSGIRAVAVLDSHRVVSGSDDRTLRVWDVKSGEVQCLFTLDAPITAIAVSDCRIIVAGDSSGRVHFFDFVEP